MYSIGACEIGYTGVLCNECDENYGKISDTVCASCDGATYILTILGGILLGFNFHIYILIISIY